METILAIKLKDVVITLSDTNAGRSIVKMKDDEDKILVLDQHKLLLTSGEAGDRIQFCEYISKNVSLYELRNGYELTMNAAANYIRNELATAVRQSPYQVNLILAGHDSHDGPSLYFMDYLGSMQKMSFTCHGYAGYFLLSLLDKHWREGMSIDEGVQLLHMCIQELKTRFIVNTNYIAKAVGVDGVRVVPLLPAA
eukprot:TRINITY_DN664_c0_g1_i1.p1 TRINITY_DN664_c0_g1~~TRINITY_DN664_c0_g1_i1.p1  ORF type:complete len:196 (-),score=43.20 TRINITY_DN664_c0_g1_i1:86-673(-)